MTPKPWSHSALDDFKNCPRSFYEKRIAKSVVETKGEATIWGEVVHKHFEEFMRDGVALPATLGIHEEFLLKLQALPGTHGVEQRIALNIHGQPCAFFDTNVWYRGVVDWMTVNGTSAYVVDYKTGKHHTKFQQLRLFALHTFAMYPQVESVRADYYWTQMCTSNGETYLRSDIPKLWAERIPDLKQYAEAFKTDTWQPRQSGLCRGWCPVDTCEFWSPRRQRG